MASQKLNKPKLTVLYARVSQEDDRANESDSIVNQRRVLEKYAAENGFQNTVFLYDDGYTGTNFRRPAWQKLREMMDAGQVGTLIVKDQSRLGREHLESDWYMELYFLKMKIRFIAIGDNVDSDVEGSGDFAPLRNWMNEFHPKETSKKVRDVKNAQGERGERSGGRIPYGYQKRSADSKDLIPDEETAPIVQRIFALCASGKGPSQIARMLTKEEILTPSHYYFRKYGVKAPKMNMNRPFSWSNSTVEHLLDNIVYLGHTLSHKTTTVSYKDKTVVHVPEEEQILVENTHEPLISEEIWNIVREVRSHKRTPTKHLDTPNIFSGLAFCSDCGSPLTPFRDTSDPPTRHRLKCSNYGKHGKTACTPHNVREMDLTAVVLNDIRRVTEYARTHEDQFVSYIQQKDSKQIQRDIADGEKEIASMERRIGELTALFRHLYEDKVKGEITPDQFKMLSAGYNEEQKQLEAALPVKEAELTKLRESTSNVEWFVTKAKQYASIDDLSPELLRMFVQRIEIGEREKKGSRNSPQTITIFYRDVGIIDTANFEAKTQPVKAGKNTARRLKVDNRPTV